MKSKYIISSIGFILSICLIIVGVINTPKRGYSLASQTDIQKSLATIYNIPDPLSINTVSISENNSMYNFLYMYQFTYQNHLYLCILEKKGARGYYPIEIFPKIPLEKSQFYYYNYYINNDYYLIFWGYNSDYKVSSLVTSFSNYSVSDSDFVLEIFTSSEPIQGKVSAYDAENNYLFDFYSIENPV